MDLSLIDKIIFIAGSSQGIGFAIAKGFLQEGAKVVITSRNPQSLDDAHRTLLQEGDQDHILKISGDLTDPKTIKAALEKTIMTFGRLDSVIANIGSGTARGGWDLSLDDWQAVFDKNLFGSMTLASAAMPYLIESGGNLTFISSIVSKEAISAPITYSAAKAALEIAMKNLSRLAGADGVRINAVAPGNILFPGGSWEKKLSERREFFENYIQTEVALQRFGKLEEVADAVLFLSSRRSSFITGACLVVDGGQTRSL